MQLQLGARVGERDDTLWLVSRAYPHPRMGRHCVDVQPPLRVHSQHAPDQILQRRRAAPPQLVRILELPRPYPLVHDVGRLAAELGPPVVAKRVGAADRHVQDDAERPDVCLGAVVDCCARHEVGHLLQRAHTNSASQRRSGNGGGGRETVRNTGAM